MTIAEGNPAQIQGIRELLKLIWGWMKMLEIAELNVRYGGIHAVRGVNLTVPQGSIVTLVGANGAGKALYCGLYVTL